MWEQQKGFVHWGFNEDNLRMFHKSSYVVSHNAGVLLPSYSTTQEFSYVVSHGTEDSIPLWNTTEKNNTTQNYDFKFKVPLIAFR